MAGQVVEHVLSLSPLQRRMQANEVVPIDKLTAFPAIQERLLRHEPLQYVLGVAHFAGLELEVTRATLIPRPETEELVALILQEQRGKAGIQVLDIGTGSGCIPLALAQGLPGSCLTAVDISAEALIVARRNAARCSVSIEFQQLDILHAAPRIPAPLDVLVSNPPTCWSRSAP